GPTATFLAPPAPDALMPPTTMDPREPAPVPLLACTETEAPLVRSDRLGRLTLPPATLSPVIEKFGAQLPHGKGLPPAGGTKVMPAAIVMFPPPPPGLVASIVAAPPV